MAGTKNHDLSDLTGKKIKSITLQEVDLSGGDQDKDVRQFYHILCSDGDKLVLACEDSTATLMDSDDFADLMEQLECEEDGALDEDDEDDDEDESDEDNLFDADDEDFGSQDDD